jgi:hypothetical protein
MAGNHEHVIAVRIAITVYVNPTKPELLDIINRSGGSRSIIDVVRCEIESNLESVSYVRHAFVE